MKLKSVEIENYRAIEQLKLRLDPQLTVFHGANGYGKTSVLSAIAVGLGAISKLLSDVSDLDFCEEDQREGAGAPRVSPTDMDGNSWERQGGRQADDRMVEQRSLALADFLERQFKRPGADEADLPIAAFYSTDRIVSGLSKVPDDPKVRFPRFTALKGALDARTDFGGLFTWFYFKEDEELRSTEGAARFRLSVKGCIRGSAGDLVHASGSVRSAHRVESTPFCGVPEIGSGADREALARPAKWGLSHRAGAGGRPGAADGAGQSALGQPARIRSIVLIDEIELHLHPSWQQRILGDLRRTFPNAQFIVSTHSPQVLTTVEPQHIVELYRDGDRIVAGAPGGATYGAEAGDVLSVVMGVDERPPENRFTKALDQYRRLIREERWESKEALALRESLESMSPYDSALDRADLEIKRRKLFKQRAESQ